MKLVIFGIENEIVFKEGKINVLEVQDKKFFRKILDILNDECNNLSNNNEIVLKENEENISLQKNMHIVFDIFNIDFSDKKIISKIYSIIEKNIKNKEDYELEKINLDIRNFLVNEINEIPIEFTMKNEIDIIELLKIYNVKIDEICYNELIDKIEFLIDILSTLQIAKILVLPNLKRYFEKDELEEIYKYANYKNIYLLVIENEIIEGLLKYEQKNIIDSEFDDIIKT